METQKLHLLTAAVKYLGIPLVITSYPLPGGYFKWILVQNGGILTFTMNSAAVMWATENSELTEDGVLQLMADEIVARKARGIYESGTWNNCQGYSEVNRFDSGSVDGSRKENRQAGQG